MSEQQAAEATETDASTEANDENAQQPETLPDDHPLVRTLEAQKQQIKELRERARRLDEIEDSQKTEAEKAAEKLSTAEQRASEAETRLARLEVALDKGLTPSQAKRLVGGTREELEADADELLRDLAAKPRQPKPDMNQGRQSSGSASTADQFAASVGGLLT